MSEQHHNYTMTEATESKSGYNNHMGKDRGRYKDVSGFGSPVLVAGYEERCGGFRI